MIASTILLALGASVVSAVPCGSHGSSAASSSSASTSASTPSTNGTSSSNASGSVSSSAVKCPVVLDGRVPVATELSALDTTNALFNPDYVKGNNLSWSDILLFPSTANSRFDDADAFKSLEVTINNASIFQKQYGFRRAGLQFANDTNENSTGYVGLKTLHWSVKQDPARALNLSHEYLNVWHEASDYSADQLMFQTGKMIDIPDLDASAFKIFDRDSTLLWSTPIDETEWQNFAVTMDIDAK